MINHEKSSSLTHPGKKYKMLPDHERSSKIMIMINHKKIIKSHPPPDKKRKFCLTISALNHKFFLTQSKMKVISLENVRYGKIEYNNDII
jgi:hypothetical protein